MRNRNLGFQSVTGSSWLLRTCYLHFSMKIGLEINDNCILFDLVQLLFFALCFDHLQHASFMALALLAKQLEFVDLWDCSG